MTTNNINNSNNNTIINNNSSTASAYLQQHNISHLFQQLYFKLITEQPNDPIQYIINNIHSINNNVQSIHNDVIGSNYYTVDELTLLFNMLDPLNHGYIYKQDINIGLNQLNINIDTDNIQDNQKYNLQQFINICQDRLKLKFNNN